MGGLGAATEHHPQGGNALAQVFEQLQKTGRTGSGKGTARKEDGIATFIAIFRQGKAGKKGRGATLLVSQQPFMFREGSISVSSRY